MTKRIVARAIAVGFMFSIATGCAVRPVVDPRNPAPARDGPVVLRELRRRVKKAFDQAGIEIPFPHVKMVREPEGVA